MTICRRRHPQSTLAFAATLASSNLSTSVASAQSVERQAKRNQPEHQDPFQEDEWNRKHGVKPEAERRFDNSAAGRVLASIEATRPRITEAPPADPPAMIQEAPPAAPPNPKRQRTQNKGTTPEEWRLRALAKVHAYHIADSLGCISGGYNSYASDVERARAHPEIVEPEPRNPLLNDVSASFDTLSEVTKQYFRISDSGPLPDEGFNRVSELRKRRWERFATCNPKKANPCL